MSKDFIIQPLGHFGLLRSAAFRLPLTKGLASSWNHLFVQVGIKETFISILNTFQNVV
jgi:hypothetical protein